MASSLPAPLAATLGLLPAAVDGARRLPMKAVQLPVIVLGTTLSGLDTLRREYESLAERGEQLYARLRGETIEKADELEDRVVDLVARTPFATAYDKAEDALEDIAEAVQRAPLGFAHSVAESVVETVVETATEAVTDVDVPADEAPKGEPTPKATEPDSTRVDTAATPAVVEVVELAVAQTPVVEVGRDELPLPDYDHMTLGSLRGRMRALSVDQLVQVRAYEKAHADRLPIVTMLDNRIAKLAADAVATTGVPAPLLVAAPAAVLTAAATVP